MFWKGKISWFTQLEAFLRQRDLEHTGHYVVEKPSSKIAEIAKPRDAPGIAKLLNQWFEVNPKCSTAVTVTWVLESFIKDTIWIIIKDRGGTIRGCVSSVKCEAPYPSALDVSNWGTVDWFCVHPLWRSKGLGSALLETLDYVTYERGRRCHVFLKEGMPLPLPHVPVYAAFLRCRRAGNTSIVVMPSSEKGVYPYMTKEKATGLPLVRVDLSVLSEKDLDTILPPCIVFSSFISSEQGWKTDSLVSMYAFRWTAGKWLGSRPNPMII